MYKNRFRGFTLIELLVVIAIIGILSAVVLASLSTARDKGSNAAIQSNLDTIRTQAEIYFGDNGNKYSSTGAAVSACSGVNTMFANTTIANAISAADNANGSGSKECNISSAGDKYAVQVQFVPLTPTTIYWCVDSNGKTATTSTALGAGTNC